MATTREAIWTVAGVAWEQISLILTDLSLLIIAHLLDPFSLTLKLGCHLFEGLQESA